MMMMMMRADCGMKSPTPITRARLHVVNRQPHVTDISDYSSSLEKEATPAHPSFFILKRRMLFLYS